MFTIKSLEKFLPKGVKGRETSSLYLLEHRKDRDLPFKKTFSLNKRSFIYLIDWLEEATDRSEAATDAGVDIYEIETLYIECIELLLSRSLKKKSLYYIQTYLYGAPLHTLPSDESTEIFSKVSEMETSEDLWVEIKLLELKSKK